MVVHRRKTTNELDIATNDGIASGTYMTAFQYAAEPHHVVRFVLDDMAVQT
jgi:hypothetical protein